MSNDLEIKDTQYKVRECVLAAQAVQGAIKLHDFPAGLADLLTKLSRLNDRLAVLAASADTSTNAPALSQSEPKEEVQAAATTRSYSCERCYDTGHIGGFRENGLCNCSLKQSAITKEDVEAAYREGWKRGYETPGGRKLSRFREDWGWDDSEAKKKLEGK